MTTDKHANLTQQMFNQCLTSTILATKPKADFHFTVTEPLYYSAIDKSHSSGHTSPLISSYLQKRRDEDLLAPASAATTDLPR